MNAEDLQAVLTRDPFVPLRLHLVNCTSVRVPASRAAWLIPNAVVVLQNVRPGSCCVDGYDVIALRNIARIQEFPDGDPEHL